MENKDKTILEASPFKKPDVVLFTFQISLIFIVVCVSLMNLSLQWGNQNLWTVILYPKVKLSNEPVSVNSLKTVVDE